MQCSTVPILVFVLTSAVHILKLEQCYIAFLDSKIQLRIILFWAHQILGIRFVDCCSKIYLFLCLKNVVCRDVSNTVT
jgi:hypothetical protein